MFESSEAALDPLRTRLPWGEPFTGTVAVPESELSYRIGFGRSQVTYFVWVFTDPSPEGWRVSYQFDRVPDGRLLRMLPAVAIPVVVAAYQGSLLGVGIFSGVFGVALLLDSWRVIVRSREIERAIRVIYTE